MEGIGVTDKSQLLKWQDIKVKGNVALYNFLDCLSYIKQLLFQQECYLTQRPLRWLWPEARELLKSLFWILSAVQEKTNCYNMGNSLDIERFKEAPGTNAPVNFVENVFRIQYLWVYSRSVRQVTLDLDKDVHHEMILRRIISWIRPIRINQEG